MHIGILQVRYRRYRYRTVLVQATSLPTLCQIEVGTYLEYLEENNGGLFTKSVADPVCLSRI
jgi:hypothetical protein